MSSRQNRRNSGGSSGGAPGWMTTFSDLMSLLLTFFILLFSISNIDAVKFRNISYSLQAVLSGIGQPSIMQSISRDNVPLEDDIQISDTIDKNTIKEELLVMYDMVRDYVENEGLVAEVSVNMNKRGIYVDIKEAILFESGRAHIKDDGIKVLEKLKGLINNFNNDIVIEGHTDDIPVSSFLYPSNWELSTARAVSVVRYLSEKEGIASDRLSAVGYGEYRPIVPNDNSKNRTINRRVNILIVMDGEGGVVNGN